MLGGVHDFTIEQGQQWVRKITWKDSGGTEIDLSGAATATLYLRPWRGHVGAIDSGYNIGGSDPRLTQDGGAEIALANADPNIVMTIVAATTASLDFIRGEYTLEVTPAGGVLTRVLQGTMFLEKETTSS